MHFLLIKENWRRSAFELDKWDNFTFSFLKKTIVRSKEIDGFGILMIAFIVFFLGKPPRF